MSHITIYQITEDPLFATSIEMQLDLSRFAVVSFRSVDEYLSNRDDGGAGCVFFDAFGDAALDLVRLLAFERLDASPIIAVTNSSGPPVKRLLESGAFEALEMQDLERELVAKLENALVHSRMSGEILRQSEKTKDSLKNLSSRQAEIVQKVLEGKGNKAIAFALKVSTRTVEIERAAVLKIFHAKNAIELAHRIGQYQGIACLCSRFTNLRGDF